MTDPLAPSDEAAERRSRLLGLKLRILVREHLGADESVAEPTSFPPGAALRHGGDAWVFLADRPGGRLGAALAWTLRSGAGSLQVVADDETGVLARRAAEFTLPISVWYADDRSLLPAVPEPVTVPRPAPTDHDVFRERIIEGGAEPVVEHGVLAGEVRGLEVCRVVDDVDTGTTRLEVGVGAHDREAFQMLHGDLPPAAALARVVEAVLEHRVPGAPQHPLNRLAAERLIRWRLEREPQRVGARSLAPMQPPVARSNLKDPIPCAAFGIGISGDPVVVVCSSGVDLDLVPYAADARLAAEAAEPGVAGGVRLVIATPSRDRVPVTDEIGGLLRDPVEFVAVD